MQMTSIAGKRAHCGRALAAVFLAIVAGFGMLAGCGGGGSESTAEVIGGETDEQDQEQDSAPLTDDASDGSTIVADTSIPGTPIIYGSVAGDETATISFSPPVSTGNSAITYYTVNCVAGIIVKSKSQATSPITVGGLTNGTVYSCSASATNADGTGANSPSVQVQPTDGTTGTPTGTLTGHLYCPYDNSVINAGLSLTSTVSMRCSGTVRTMTGNGVPDHVTGTFPNPNNPPSITAQSVSFKTTLNPALTSTISAIEHIIGYANNGVKFDPATMESYLNAGIWKIEALGHSYVNFGTDTNNAHVQPNGAYHYHGMPEEYVTLLNPGQAAKMTLVGFANDGFPIYARWGYTTANDPSSAIKVVKPSYRLKSAPDAGRPATTIAEMGSFTQDYEYVAGLGDLDECNGRTGVTPDFPGGIYHYYITDDYPYIQRCIKGTAMVGQ